MRPPRNLLLLQSAILLLLLTISSCVTVPAPETATTPTPGAALEATPDTTPREPAATRTPSAKATLVLPQPVGFVNDFADALDDAAETRLETTLADLKKRSQIEMAIAVIKTTEGSKINDYSLAVARGWKIGPLDSETGGGLLLLVAIDDRKWHLQVSRKLEGDLPPPVIAKIGEPAHEPFRRGDYGAGIEKFVDNLIATLSQKRGF